MQSLTTQKPMPSLLPSNESLSQPVPPVYILSMTSYAWNIPLASLGWLSWLCPLATSRQI